MATLRQQAQAEVLTFDISQLSDEQWGPERVSRQSRYINGVCERCGQDIDSGTEYRTRAWLNGPASTDQHIVCPEGR